MAHSVQYQHGNTIILFDSGRSYVVCNLPKRQEDYKIHDKLGRSQEEKKFLDAFERMFYAAAQGDLKKCQAIIEEEKFSDIDAYSVNKFANQANGQSLDYVSVRYVAEMNKHKPNRLGYYLMEVRKEYGGYGKVVEPENFKQLVKLLKEKATEQRDDDLYSNNFDQ